MASTLLQGLERAAQRRAAAAQAAAQGDWAEARQRYSEAEEADALGAVGRAETRHF